MVLLMKSYNRKTCITKTVHNSQNWGWRLEIWEEFLKETSLMKPERREPKRLGLPDRGKDTCRQEASGPVS